MATIRFAHVYSKLPPDPSPSTLLEVFTVNVDDLHPNFVEYDTRIVDGGNYPLPVGKVLVLLLQSESGALFTTIRRCTPSKREHYRGLRGKMVEIDVVEVNHLLDTYL